MLNRVFFRPLIYIYVCILIIYTRMCVYMKEILGTPDFNISMNFFMFYLSNFENS